MKRAFPHSPATHRDARGVALIIVLAFVVLLTGLLVAFFSRAILDRQISNSSANQAKVELFAQGAVDTIVGDLKQEIVAGSNVSTPATGYTVYTPKVPATTAPAVVGSPVNNGLENLLKRSVNGQPFYPATNYDGNASNRAAAVSTLTPSQNGRAIAPRRWNKHLLLEKASTLTSGANDQNDTVFTPVGATEAAGTTNATWPYAPDWILVDRNGSNPQSLAATATAPAPNILGRFAYAIYDEGGLLDMNVAGNPTVMTTQQTAYKSSLAYADLHQVPGIADLPSSTRKDTIINAIVGWRNGVSASTDFTTQPPVLVGPPLQGPFPNYNWTASTTPSYATNFANSLTANTSGFLRTSSPLLANGQTDRMFASRQGLMRLLLQGTATSGTGGANERANLQNALRYLGTFSRGVNQPSFVPVPTSTTPDATHRPAIQTIANGGNDASGGDNIINPADTTYPAGFLSIRIPSTLPTLTRADGTLATVGEPLVKKRFNLSRLAWLTYKGPSALLPSSDPIITKLITQGYSLAFLQQGTVVNIRNYFGLRWAVDNSISTGLGDNTSKWFYNFHLWGGSGTGTKGPIMTLPQIAALNTAAKQHEPDFFELLKASINAGSLGKAYFYNANADATTPAGYQQQRDNSVDAQVMQIAANIIDQFDSDGYSTHIIFNDNSLFGGKPQEYRGVEDLPYLYRLREGKITIRDSSPPQANLPTVSSTAPTDAGLLAVLQIPEVWNPHAWNSTNPDTNPRPVNFRVVGISTDPNSPSSAATNVTVGTRCLVWSGSNYGGASPATNVPSSPGPVWNEANTELDFGVPVGKLGLYREPTPLAKPGIPDPSVQIGPANVLNSVSVTAYLHSQWPSSQFKSNGVSDDQKYIGILAGSGPVAWAALVPKQGIDASTPQVATSGVVEATSAYLPATIKGITYRLQYQDPSGTWTTYDEKFADYLAASSYNNGTYWTDNNKTFNSFNGTSQDNIMGTELGSVCFDPRTSRFGMSLVGYNGYRGGYWSQFPVRMTAMKVGWASGNTFTGGAFTGAISQLALATERPDDNAGFSFGGGGISFLATGPTAPGWYPAATTSAVIQPGMFAQNNPAEASIPTNQRQVNGDNQTVGGTLNQYFSDADGVVRRAMAAYVPTTSTDPATPPTGGLPSGLPLKTAHDYSTGTATPNSEIASRPVMLNRPFRSPADLGVVFSGTPWQNLSVSTPESGAAALLDVFSTGNDTDDPNSMIAGRVNLNTRQAPVVQAIITGAMQDELNVSGSTVAPPLLAADAKNIGAALVARTSSTAAGKGPLANLSEIVGRWNGPTGGPAYDGSQLFTGFSGADLAGALPSATTANGDTLNRITRFRESSIRALASTGETRVWNLMIDLVAQTGRYPTGNTKLANFIVEGEQRYWVHVAIDRSTGQVIDKQVEVVKE